MKLVKRIDVLIICLGTLLSSCASYRATELSALDPVFVKECDNAEGLAVGCKEFGDRDCDTYLDRDVRRKGYHAIQLTFQNASDKCYKFSTDNMSIPVAKVDEVAGMVHTSTLGRMLLFAPLVLPAIVDGVLSSNANTRLDDDFSRKAKGSFTIEPHSFKKTVVFIPHDRYEPSFDLILEEQPTGEFKRIRLRATR